MNGESGSIGFIGTGTIGAPMAQRRIEAGHALVVCDQVEAASAPLVAAGAKRAASPCEVAAACRVVFTSLPGPREVEEVATGLLAGARPGDVHVDLSTSAYDAVRALAAREAAAGVHLVDAPVSGGAVGATQGTLTVMASGDAVAFERVRPLFDAFAKNVFYLGPAGGDAYRGDGGGPGDGDGGLHVAGAGARAAGGRALGPLRAGSGPLR